MKNHTGDDASNIKGLFKCSKQGCTGTIHMKGNYKDKFPPCGKCREGVDFILVDLKG